MNKFLMGSTYFFACYDDFESKDIDEIEIVDKCEFNWLRQLTGCNKCLFQIKRKNNIEDYINYALQSRQGMVIGKFLIPEFCEAIGFTISDLPKLTPLLEKLDDKHKYEEIIFNSYIKNNAFKLTESQRKMAFRSYKASRGD